MDYTTLGRTGLKVSVMGIGCGGPSRVGKNTGRSMEESVAVIRMGLDAGINFIDTAEGYGTEEIVGKAIRDVDRDSVVLSTKKSTSRNITPKDVEKSLEASLRRLGTDYVDIYNLHGVLLKDYDHLVSEAVPTLQKLRDQGKIGFIGITERFGPDSGHAMLQRALQDDIWEVMMVGFNILNQSARERVFPKTIEKNIGVMIMFAVRRALSRPEILAETIQEILAETIQDLIESEQLYPADIDENNPLGFLVHEGGAVSIVDAAYRFCRYEPGTNVILSGTGNAEHLKANMESFSRPPLPQADVLWLKEIFRWVDSVSG
jgi:aryl-alcohol dehydrogenase-like predicted oxidoreductase